MKQAAGCSVKAGSLPLYGSKLASFDYGHPANLGQACNIAWCSRASVCPLRVPLCRSILEVLHELWWLHFCHYVFAPAIREASDVLHGIIRARLAVGEF